MAGEQPKSPLEGLPRLTREQLDDAYYRHCADMEEQEAPARFNADTYDGTISRMDQYLASIATRTEGDSDA